MNDLTIIGNLTRDPELRTTQTGVNVCSFTVAVNRRGKKDEADYFRVTAWRQLADLCQQYLSKGRKAAVTGPVSVSTYTANDGTTRATLEVTADSVEFLSPREEAASAPPPAARPAPQQTSMQPPNGYEEVVDDDLPF